VKKKLYILFFCVILFGCTTTPQPRNSHSLLVISSLLPGGPQGRFKQSQKLLLVRDKDGFADPSIIFTTDEYKKGYFYTYNMPPGTYYIAGAVYEYSVSNTYRKRIFVFRRESVLRCKIVVKPNTVIFGGRLQFDTMEYDELIADDFQKSLLSTYNPLLITNDAHTLNKLIFSYSVFFGNTAFIENSNKDAVKQEIKSELQNTRWNSYVFE
jgi:hypothetical protein